MNSVIMNFLGIGWLDPAVYLITALLLIIILFIMLLVQNNRIKKLKKRIDELTTGEEGRSLEKEITDLFRQNEDISEKARSNDHKLTQLSRQIKGCIQKTGLIRYDAFSQMGGKLSFAMTLLDEEDNGIILNSVRSTDSSYSYIKEIKDGKCEMELSGDEQKSLHRALAGFDQNE